MVKRNDRWSALSMSERAEVFKRGVQAGINDRKTIIDVYNSFGDGGDKDPWYKRLYNWMFNNDEEEENKYLTEDNYLEEHSKFRDTFEEFYPKAYYDSKGKSYTVGTGLVYLIDDKGKEIAVKKGDTITKEENLKQLQLRGQLAEKYARNKTKFWDNYPPELKFQILDAMFNVGNYAVWHKSPNYQAALRRYEAAEGWNNPDYDLNDIFQHADWNLNDKGWLGVRSRMRRNPQSINPDDYNLIYKNHYRDSLRTVYDEKFQNK